MSARFTEFSGSEALQERLAVAQINTGEKDALIVMTRTLLGLAVTGFSFMAGAMGSVVVARFIRAVEVAIESHGEHYRSGHYHQKRTFDDSGVYG